MPIATDKLTAATACDIIRSQKDNILTGISAASGFPAKDFTIEMTADQPNITYDTASFTIIHNPSNSAVTVFPQAGPDIKKLIATPYTRHTHLEKQIDLTSLLTHQESSCPDLDYKSSINFSWPKNNNWQKVGYDIWTRIFSQTHKLWYAIDRDRNNVEARRSAEKTTHDTLTALGWTIKTAKDRDPVANKKNCPEIILEPTGNARLSYNQSFDAIKLATFLGSLSSPT